MKCLTNHTFRDAVQQANWTKQLASQPHTHHTVTMTSAAVQNPKKGYWSLLTMAIQSGGRTGGVQETNDHGSLSPHGPSFVYVCKKHNTLYLRTYIHKLQNNVGG